MTKSNTTSRVAQIPRRAVFTFGEQAKLAEVTRHTRARLLDAHHVEFLR